jgi:hypothetical protein
LQKKKQEMNALNRTIFVSMVIVTAITVKQSAGRREKVILEIKEVRRRERE